MRTLYTLGYLLLASPIFAQEKEQAEMDLPTQHFLDYNHDTGEGMLINGKLRIDDKISVRVTDVNRLMYAVKVTGMSETFESEPPPGVATLLGFQVQQRAEPNDAVENLTNSIPSLNTPTSNDLEKKEKELADMKEQIARSSLIEQGLKDLEVKFMAMQDGDLVLRTQKFLNTEVIAATEKADSANSMRERVKVLETEVAALRTQLRENVDAGIRFNALTHELTTKFQAFAKAFDRLEEMKALFNKLHSIAYHEGFNSYEAARHLTEVVKDMPYLNDKAKLVREFGDREAEVQAALQRYRNSPDALAILKDRSAVDRSVKLMADRVTKLSASVASYDHEKLFKNIDALYWSLGDASLFTIVSDPIQATADLVNLKVEIRSKDGIAPLAPMIDRSFTHESFVTGGIRRDWSSGILFNLGLGDQSFRLDPSTSDDTKVVVVQNEQREMFKPGLAGLLHVGPRWSGHVHVAGVVGAGLNEADLTKATFFLGGSIGFGRREKVFLSFGAAGRQRDVLVASRTVGDLLDAEGSSTLPLTEKAFTIGGFVGVSVTLTKQNKEETKPAQR